MQTEVVFSEVASLAQLTRLKIRLPVECMLKDFPSHWKNLSNFSILVGEMELLNVWWRDSYHELGTRRMFLEMGSSTQNLEPSIRISNLVGVLSEKVELLEVHHYHHLSTVADLNSNGLFQTLRQLYVHDCLLLRHLSSTNARKPVFSKLEELRLRYLMNFVAICDGPLPEGFLFKLKMLRVIKCRTVSILIPFDLLGNLQRLEKLYLSSCDGLEKVVQLEGSMSKQPPSLIFPCLRKIDISDCNKLKCVLPLKTARHLKELQIWRCSDMEMVFEGDDGDDAGEDNVTLPHLYMLVLWGIPSLTSFGPPGLLFDFPALINMTVRDCGNLKRLPLLGKQSIPKLKNLDVESSWLDGLECDDESRLKVHLKSLPGLMEY